VVHHPLSHLRDLPPLTFRLLSLLLFLLKLLKLLLFSQVLIKLEKEQSQPVMFGKRLQNQAYLLPLNSPGIRVKVKIGVNVSERLKRTPGDKRGLMTVVKTKERNEMK